MHGLTFSLGLGATSGKRKSNKKVVGCVCDYYYYLPESNNSLKSSLLHLWLLTSVENGILHKKGYTFSSSARKKKESQVSFFVYLFGVCRAP